MQRYKLKIQSGIRRPKVFNASQMKRIQLLKRARTLSYKQLLRVSAVIVAKNNGEKKEAMVFVRSLTPPERQFIKQFETLGVESRQEVLNALNNSIKIINRRDAEKIDGKALLNTLMKDIE